MSVSPITQVSHVSLYYLLNLKCAEPLCPLSELAPTRESVSIYETQRGLYEPLKLQVDAADTCNVTIPRRRQTEWHERV